MKNAPFKHPLIRLGFPTSTLFLNLFDRNLTICMTLFQYIQCQNPKLKASIPISVGQIPSWLGWTVEAPSFSTHGQSWIPSQAGSGHFGGSVSGSWHSWSCPWLPKILDSAPPTEKWHGSPRISTCFYHLNRFKLTGPQVFDMLQLRMGFKHPKSSKYIQRFSCQWSNSKMNPTSSSCFRPRWVPSAPEM